MHSCLSAVLLSLKDNLMALVNKGNGYVELRHDVSGYVTRTFDNVSVCDEDNDKKLILLLRSDSGYVELRSSLNGALLLIINDGAYIDASFEGDQIRLVNKLYCAEQRNINDGGLISSKSISTKPVSAS